MNEQEQAKSFAVLILGALIFASRSTNQTCFDSGAVVRSQSEDALRDAEVFVETAKAQGYDLAQLMTGGAQ